MNRIIQVFKDSFHLNGVGSNHSSPDFHVAIHSIYLLEHENISVGTSTFTFYVNYNHFIQ